MKPFWKPLTKNAPAHEQLATAAQSNNMSLVKVPPGTVYREGVVWDLSKPWHGRELQSYNIRRSAWSKSTVVNLFVPISGASQRLCAFTVHLDLALSDEDAKQAAEVYMMALNMRREE